MLSFSAIFIQVVQNQCCFFQMPRFLLRKVDIWQQHGQTNPDNLFYFFVQTIFWHCCDFSFKYFKSMFLGFSKFPNYFKEKCLFVDNKLPNWSNFANLVTLICLVKTKMASFQSVFKVKLNDAVRTGLSRKNLEKWNWLFTCSAAGWNFYGQGSTPTTSATRLGYSWYVTVTNFPTKVAQRFWIFWIT